MDPLNDLFLNGVLCHLPLCILSSSRLSSTTFARLFLYFAKSNSSPTLVDLIFLLILSIHMTLILSYPYLHIHSHTFFIFPSNALDIIYDVTTGTKEDNYLLVRRRTIFLGQLKGDLGANQLVGQYLDVLLDGHKATRNRNWNRYLVLLDLQLLT